jgi:hypothetical protein
LEKIDLSSLSDFSVCFSVVLFCSGDGSAAVSTVDLFCSEDVSSVEVETGCFVFTAGETGDETLLYSYVVEVASVVPDVLPG